MITEKEWVLASRLNQGYIIFIFYCVTLLQSVLYVVSEVTWYKFGVNLDKYMP